MDYQNGLSIVVASMVNYKEISFKERIKGNRTSLRTMFPTIKFDRIATPDMNSRSGFFGKDNDHEDLRKADLRIQAFQKKNPGALIANGYLEQRSFYNTKAYERRTEHGTEFRNIHLGTDFWLASGTPVHAPFQGEIVIAHDNAYNKDYGPTLVLKHTFDDFVFYTLYGHLSRLSLELSEVGKTVDSGELIGYIGQEYENGNWVPHLHFQVITDLLGNTENYNGVAFPSEIKRWKKLCPNPDHLFLEHLPSAENLKGSV